MADSILLRIACKAANTPEIFRSVQGEGRNIGRLRTFVRLSGCNLHCVWCDTAYTWRWHGSAYPHVADRPGAAFTFDPVTETVSMTLDEIAAAIAALPSEGVVITGGEPLLQMRGVTALAARLHQQKPSLKIEIETNGTIFPTEALREHVELFMVSPKLAHSGNRNENALRPGALRAFAAAEQTVFKFVVKDIVDIGYISDLASELGITPSRIYVMPEGTDSDTVIRAGAKLIDSVINAGFNYSDRLHIHLFGEKRGK